MVEFALVFPLFFLIVLFLIDCGYVIYQRASFDYGVTHASWHVEESVLGDPGDYESFEDGTDTDGSSFRGELEEALRESIRESALIGFRPSSLTVTVTEASLHNEPEIFRSVPGPDGEEIRSRLITRKMTVRAEAACRMTVLTPVGRRLFGEHLTVRKTMDYERVVGKQIRNAGTYDHEKDEHEPE